MNSYEYLVQAFRAVAVEKQKGGITGVRLANLLLNLLDYITGNLNLQAELIAGKADIVGGKVPMSQLPDGLDDMQEYNTRTAFPVTGQDGIIYVAKDTSKTYRWSGTTYSAVGDSLTLGETGATAYPGDKGKANAQAIGTLQRMMNTLEENMSGKADAEHSHSMSDIAGLTAALNGKASSVHSHQIEDISGLEERLQDLEDLYVVGLDVQPDSDNVGVSVVYIDNTTSPAAKILPVDADNAGVMTPAMFAKLGEMDDKANENHTHVVSDISGLPGIIDTINDNLDSNATKVNSNSEDINMLREEIQGKNVCKVFDTRTDADGWMSDPISRRQLLVGSFIFIKNQAENDYRILEVLDSPDTTGANPTGFYYKVQDVQRDLPSLVGYAKTAADNIFTGDNTFQGETDFEDVVNLYGQTTHYDLDAWYSNNDTNAPDTVISNGGVTTGMGGRYSGHNTSLGESYLEVLQWALNPFDDTRTEEYARLLYNALVFKDATGEVSLTPSTLRTLANLDSNKMDKISEEAFNEIFY